MKNDHVKQHYIPQFIIRNFCKTDGKVYYYDKKNNLTPGELDEFYKKNLGRLVKCRSLEEAVMDNKIDGQFIRYAIDILFGITNKHLVLFVSDEKIDFILGDVYPIGIAQLINYIGAMPLTCLVFPISHSRAIALVDTYSDFHDKVKQFKVKNNNWYKEPEKFGQGYLIQCNYLTDDFVCKINESIFQGSIDGVCFRSGRKTGLLQLD